MIYFYLLYIGLLLSYNPDRIFTKLTQVDLIYHCFNIFLKISSNILSYQYFKTMSNIYKILNSQLIFFIRKHINNVLSFFLY
jgi:hypothetical protein